jgi:hypothetical protein
VLHQAILSDVPRGRLADLAARKAGGHLTPLEALALTILRGGAEGEEAAPAMLDEALATYNHGGYRVPVRVVADRKRLKVVITPTVAVSDADAERTIATVRKWISDGSVALILHAGWRCDVYEVPTEAESATIVNMQEGGGNG